MEVTSGLHVHLGHSKGWTLDQLKRFACFWFLAEDTIMHLHRKDRGTDEKWCAKMKTSSNLWQALYSDDRNVREEYESIVEWHSEELNEQYLAFMREEVPNMPGLDQLDLGYLRALYRISSITNLRWAMNSDEVRVGLRWRVGGYTSTFDPQATMKSQTIEARIMAGTLDADHIINWITILEHIVTIARDWSRTRFRRMLERFIPNRTLPNLLREIGVSEQVQAYWLDPRRRDGTNTWWEYPDRDRVDWQQPFNVRGHRATHGALYD
ncbi:hypothetical protein F5Y18DRAFT_386909 [Xylariaceae sp. FL1019]|nr:hypothetical protein F5Y18DRAFT_386909 [Xylariaceae sp. FL1019]